MIIVLSWLSARHSSVPWSVCTFCSAWPSLRAGGSRPWLLCRVAALLSVWFLGLLSVPGCSAWPPSFTCCLALNFLSMHCSSARLCPLVPNLDDVNDLVLICFVWTDTHLSTALCIVRGCIGFSGWLLGLLLGLVCFICSAWPSGVLGWASWWPWHWGTAWGPGGGFFMSSLFSSVFTLFRLLGLVLFWHALGFSLASVCPLCTWLYGC